MQKKLPILITCFLVITLAFLLINVNWFNKPSCNEPNKKPNCIYQHKTPVQQLPVENVLEHFVATI